MARQTLSLAGASGWCFENTAAIGYATGFDRLTSDSYPSCWSSLMKYATLFLVGIALPSPVHSQDVKRDIPYANPAHTLQVLDVYSPKGAKNLPVVFWIHGGGWQTG